MFAAVCALRIQRRAKVKKHRYFTVLSFSTMSGVKYFVMKNEPSEFSIDHLKEGKVGKWDGIRNYQARNIMKDMKIGDKAFFYHSSCPQPGIYGSMTIHREHFPDEGALDRKNHYYDPKATEDKNPWVCVEVAFVEKFEHPLLLDDIRKLELGPCRLTAKGNRLSIIPVSEDQYYLLQSEIRKHNPSLGSDGVLMVPKNEESISDVAKVNDNDSKKDEPKKRTVSQSSTELDVDNETKGKRKQARRGTANK
jgi:predicted RNA-binding protein with PUA-like domain